MPVALLYLTAFNRPLSAIWLTIWGMNFSSPFSTTSFRVSIKSKIVVLVFIVLWNLGLKIEFDCLCLFMAGISLTQGLENFCFMEMQSPCHH